MHGNHMNLIQVELQCMNVLDFSKIVKLPTAFCMYNCFQGHARDKRRRRWPKKTPKPNCKMEKGVKD